MRDYKRDLERDIARFKATGQLPRERDVRYGRDYWRALERANLYEFEGNADAIDPRSEIEAQVSTKGGKFAIWLQTELQALPEYLQETFRAVYYDRLTEKQAAIAFGVSQSAISLRIKKLKKLVSDFCDIQS